MSDRDAGRDTCEAIRDSFPAAALDALSDAEMQQVTKHADACEPCRAELATVRRAASQLTYAAPLEPIDSVRSEALRARLHARARGAESGEATRGEPARMPSVSLPHGRGRRVGAWLVTAALAASIVALAGVIRDRQQLERRTEGERSAQSAAIASLQEELAARDTLLWALVNPEVRVIALAPPVPRAPSAIMFWNRATSQWRFVAHDLPPLAAGRVYQLWLVIDAAPTSIGVFSPDTLGRARLEARLTIEPTARPQVAITNEPAGGSVKPTGEPLISGIASR